MNHIKLLLTGGFILGLGLVTGSAFAQEPVTQEIVAPDDSIVTRPSMSEEINQVRQEYRTQLEEYRNAQRQHQIANDQYRQLGTLAALEAAVTATKRTMLARVMVLESYLTLQQLQMVDATGISVPIKEQLVTRLDAMLSELTVHRQRVEAANDRAGMTALATDFEVLAPQIEDISYEAQTHLAIGKLQTVYDKAVSLSQEVHQVATSSNQLKQAERDRAYVEIQETLNSVNVGIDEIEANLTSTDRDFTRSTFASVLRDLGTVYAGLSQSLSYLSELTRL